MEETDIPNVEQAMQTECIVKTADEYDSLIDLSVQMTSDLSKMIIERSFRETQMSKFAQTFNSFVRAEDSIEEDNNKKWSTQLRPIIKFFARESQTKSAIEQLLK